ncbi:MAG: tRNA (adenosine(37)-N6)-threonylcarbamoyltransferase complex transferase subunit TsaD [Pseudomonadota bacterium]
MLVLGLETSCDETAAAIVDGERRILSNVVLSQLDDHRAFGGVVPEIAARAHLSHLNGVVRRALSEAEIELSELDAIAATGGPGLIGGVMVGVTTAKMMAMGAGKPFLAINHLEGHALTARLTDGVSFPNLLLLVSGGHCQLLLVEAVGRYRRLGTTIDDAVGEAFDKTAKLLGLGYPGGPAVEQAASRGDPEAYPLPRPLLRRKGCDFSFSGLKTAVKRAVEALPNGLADSRAVADLAASFQGAVADILANRTRHAMAICEREALGVTSLVVAGGVAANQTIRSRLAKLSNESGYGFVAPPLALCTDNGAMIAWAGVERLRLGLVDTLDFQPRPRWPLDETAPKSIGAGAVKA